MKTSEHKKKHFQRLDALGKGDNQHEHLGPTLGYNVCNQFIPELKLQSGKQ